MSHGGARRLGVTAVEPPSDGRAGKGTAEMRGASAAGASGPIRVDSTSFEEWMKLATDNKINASNTWNFALIDYFHDMSLLRSDSGDGSINFQKASCTLDGCVKVWTSRVDSVVVETGRLLHGLQDEPSANKRGARGDEGEDGEAVDEDGEPIGSGQGKRKRKTAKESTLVKEFHQIALKGFDLEFSVDPLFKKTSADFDEGGAGGLLMNHLGVDSHMRIVFDAGDAPGVPEDAGLTSPEVSQEHDASASDSHGDGHQNSIPAPVPAQHTVAVESVDMSKLAAKLLGTDHIPESSDMNAALCDLLAPKTICPTFAPFRFAADEEGLFEDLADAHASQFEEASQASAPPAWSQAPMWEDDAMAPLDDGPEMPEMDGDADLFEEAAQADIVAPAFGPHEDMDELDGNGLDAEDLNNFDPNAGDRTASAARGGGQDVFVALGDFRMDTASAATRGDGDALFDLFDAQLSKNWAGPQHWKMRRLLRPDKDKPQGKDAGKEASTKRLKKQPMVIDFEDPEGAVDAKTLFAPPTSRTGAGGITLPRPRKHHDQGADQFLLPPDTHFNSRQLLKLFTKPRLILNVRRRGTLGAGAEMMADETIGLPMGGEDNVGETFWAEAQAARDESGGITDFDAGAGAEDDEPKLPFGDNGFDDLDDMPALDEGFERPVSFGSAKEEDWDEAQLARERQARLPAVTVNYAKKAKRIDVRRLKENIWRGLAIKGASSQAAEEDDQAAAESDTASSSMRETETPTDGEPRTMDTILTGLKGQYGQDQLEEISTSFCFICLLHLANEEGLAVKHAAVVDDEDEGAPEDTETDAEGFVGALGQLQVARDPEAGRGA